MDILDAINVHESKSSDFGKFGNLEYTMDTMPPSLKFVPVTVQHERVNARIEPVLVEKLISVAEDLGTVESILDINKAANRIAADTRRGCGNVLIYNANDEERFKKFEHFSYFVQSVSAMMKFYQTTVHALEGSIIVLYRGRRNWGEDVTNMYDGSPIMSLHTSAETPDVIPKLVNPKRRYVGWYDKNASAYVKILRFK